MYWSSPSHTTLREYACVEFYTRSLALNVCLSAPIVRNAAFGQGPGPLWTMSSDTPTFKLQLLSLTYRMMLV